MKNTSLRVRLVLSGLLSMSLYALLFADAEQVLRLTTRPDGLYFLMPVAIALAFSLVHGAFTGYFWEALGVKPKHAHVKGK
ncbi:MAG: hypothetical protein ACM3NI_01150 [Bacteroidota bacterium]